MSSDEPFDFHDLADPFTLPAFDITTDAAETIQVDFALFGPETYLFDWSDESAPSFAAAFGSESNAPVTKPITITGSKQSVKSISYHSVIQFMLSYCSAFGDHIPTQHLLDTFLQYNCKHKDMRGVSKRMLNETDSICELCHLPVYKLESTFKISDIVAVAIANLGALADRRVDVAEEKQPLNTFDMLYRHLLSFCYYEGQEKTIIVCLDRKLRWIATEFYTIYDSNETIAVPALILDVALKYHSACVVMGHNHPDIKAPNLFPSYADLVNTEKIAQLLAQNNLALIDHILVGYDAGCSILHENLPIMLSPLLHPDIPQPTYKPYSFKEAYEDVKKRVRLK
jgi:DNA repair protein RadC